MIDKEKKMLFIHIPKTAGRTIQTYFFGRWICGPHIRAMQYRDQIRTNFNDYFVFSFIRNPWDRFISAFTYLQRGVGSAASEIKLKQIVNQYDLKFFVDNLKDIPEIIGFRKIDIQLMFQSQSKYLIDKNGDKITNFIGRFETLELDIERICDCLGLEYKPLLHLNSTEHKFYRDYYDEDMKRKIADFYSEDIDRFRYVF